MPLFKNIFLIIGLIFPQFLFAQEQAPPSERLWYFDKFWWFWIAGIAIIIFISILYKILGGKKKRKKIIVEEKTNEIDKSTKQEAQLFIDSDLDLNLEKEE